MRLDAKKTGYKVLSTLVASASILTTFGSSVTPIYAEDSTDTSLTATISGDTSGNMVNTIKTNSTCDGTQQLSGTDAEVFKKITPESDGDIICAKSDGFRTEVTGTSDVKNYHWTAWYKKNVDDEPDTTNDLGNYRGFNASKVQQWSSSSKYEQGVRALNGGAFPEVRDYSYPTDTTTSKLDFWGDIAGYYSILSDPQYKNIHLVAYQQFSYKTKHTNVRYGMPAISYDDNSNSSNSGGYVSPGTGGGTSNSSGSSSGTVIIKDCPSGTHKEGKWCVKTVTKKKLVKSGYAPGGNAVTYKSLGQCRSAWPGRICQPVYKYKYYDVTTKVKYVGKTEISNDLKIISQELLGKVTKKETTAEILTGYTSDGRPKYETYTYSWETQEVKVAECDIAQNAYATELGTMPRIALKSGSGSTYTINSTKTTFWKTTPRYWTDGGKLTAKNDSSLPYHFESEETAGTGVNNVNLYSVVSNKDKLYTLIHGYPDITDTPENYDFPPNQDETCVEVDGDAVCSKKKTPPIHIDIDNGDSNPQGYEEINKAIHLTQSPESQQDIKNSKTNSH